MTNPYVAQNPYAAAQNPYADTTPPIDQAAVEAKLRANLPPDEAERHIALLRGANAPESGLLDVAKHGAGTLLSGITSLFDQPDPTAGSHLEPSPSGVPEVVSNDPNQQGGGPLAPVKAVLEIPQTLSHMRDVTQSAMRGGASPAEVGSAWEDAALSTLGLAEAATRGAGAIRGAIHGTPPEPPAPAAPAAPTGGGMPIEPHPVALPGLEQSRPAELPIQPKPPIEPHPVSLPQTFARPEGFQTPLEAALHEPSLLRAGPTPVVQPVEGLTHGIPAPDIQEPLNIERPPQVGPLQASLKMPTPQLEQAATPELQPTDVAFKHGTPAEQLAPENAGAKALAGEQVPEEFPPFEENAKLPEMEHFAPTPAAESEIDNATFQNDVPLSDDELAKIAAEHHPEGALQPGETAAEIARFSEQPLGPRGIAVEGVRNPARPDLSRPPAPSVRDILYGREGERGATPITPTDVTWWQGAKRLYLASMISGVTTLYKLAASNPIYVWWKTGPVRAGATLVDQVLRGMSGTVGREPLGTDLAKMAAKRGAAQGWTEVQQILKGIQPARGPLGTDTEGAGAFNFNEDIGPLKNIPVLGPVGQAFASLISRLHGALHRVGFSRAYEFALTERAKVLASNAYPDMKGDALNQAVENMVKNPTPEMDAYASHAAAEATLLNPNFVSKMAQGGVEAASRLGPGSGMMADMATTAVMPFARIGPNLVIQGLRASPAGAVMAIPDMVKFVKGIVTKMPKDEMSEVQGRLAERLAEAGAGTATMFMLGSMLAKSGIMVGGTPRSSEEAQMFDALGIPPYGINVGQNGLGITSKKDDYRQVWHLLGPLGLSMNMGAAWQLASSDPNTKPDEVLTSMLQPVAEEPTLRGITDFGAGVGDVAAGRSGVAPAAERFMTERMTAGVPNVVQELARQMDPIVRDPQTFGEILRNALPVSHETIPPKLGKAFGLPRVRQTSAFSPFPAFPTEGIPESFSKPVLDMFAHLATLDHRMNELNTQLLGVAQLPESPTKQAKIDGIVQQIQQRVEALTGSQSQEQ